MGHDIIAKNDVAYNRRAAGNPLNQVLYKALGVMEAYGGSSGTGETIIILKSQFQTAKEILETQDFSQLTREPNKVDLIINMLKDSGMRIYKEKANYDISQEKKFVNDCLEYIEKNNLESLEVSFL